MKDKGSEGDEERESSGKSHIQHMQIIRRQERSSNVEISNGQQPVDNHSSSIIFMEVIMRHNQTKCFLSSSLIILSSSFLASVSVPFEDGASASCALALAAGRL